MITTPGSSVAGHTVVQTIGLVKGNTIRARNVGRDIIAALKNIVGGEIEEYTKMMGEAREQATDRMIHEAESKGANAILDMRFTTSYVMSSAAEVLAFGNAVVIEPEDGRK